jgi:tRNA(Arg) A34 adenosine deaminase TadA
MYDQKLMDKAIQHAINNPIKSRGRTSISRMAAVIGNGRTFWIGLNQYKTHPMMLKFSKDHNKICLHAEVDALISYNTCLAAGLYGEELDHYDIYVARVLKDDSPALAKPCNTCFGALSYFGIRNIYWTSF